MSQAMRLMSPPTGQTQNGPAHDAHPIVPFWSTPIMPSQPTFHPEPPTLRTVPKMMVQPNNLSQQYNPSQPNPSQPNNPSQPTNPKQLRMMARPESWLFTQEESLANSAGGLYDDAFYEIILIIGAIVGTLLCVVQCARCSKYYRRYRSKRGEGKKKEKRGSVLRIMVLGESLDADNKTEYADSDYMMDDDEEKSLQRFQSFKAVSLRNSSKKEGSETGPRRRLKYLFWRKTTVESPSSDSSPDDDKVQGVQIESALLRRIKKNWPLRGKTPPANSASGHTSDSVEDSVNTREERLQRVRDMLSQRKKLPPSTSQSDGSDNSAQYDSEEEDERVLERLHNLLKKKNLSTPKPRAYDSEEDSNSEGEEERVFQRHTGGYDSEGSNSEDDEEAVFERRHSWQYEAFSDDDTEVSERTSITVERINRIARKKSDTQYLDSSNQKITRVKSESDIGAKDDDLERRPSRRHSFRLEHALEWLEDLDDLGGEEHQEGLEHLGENCKIDVTNKSHNDDASSSEDEGSIVSEAVDEVAL